MLKNILIGFLLLVILLLAFEVYSVKNTTGDDSAFAQTVSDGPYVFYENDMLKASWLCQGEESEISIPLDTIMEHEKTVQVKLNFESERLIYQGNYKVAALSDLHGQYDLMLELLINNKIIDQQKNWVFGDGHFVITGDVFDRGDKVTEILWFLFKLEQQAKDAGGQFHLLLGNHEVMILNEDLRYLNPKYKYSTQKLKKSYSQLFSENSILGNWLRSKPVLVKIDNMLFIHGGIHPKLAKEKHSLETINQVFKQNLIKSDLKTPREGFGKFLHKKSGPIWYRGYFKEEGASTEEIDLLLNHFEVDHLIVGHTTQKIIETRYQGKVIAIDSGIKRGKYGEILFIDGEKKWRGDLSGKRLDIY